VREDAEDIGVYMAFRIVTVPFDNERGVFPDNELNTFLLGKKVENYRVDFFQVDWRQYWSTFQLTKPLTRADGKPIGRLYGHDIQNHSNTHRRTGRCIYACQTRGLREREILGGV